MTPFFSFITNRSIARDISLGLTGIILVISLVLAVGYQSITTWRLGREIAARADAMIAQTGEMFYLPLYNFDNQTLEHMARVYLEGTDFVRGIAVSTEYNNLLINEIQEPVDQLIKREKVLYAQGKEIGRVTLYFSDAPLRAKRAATLRAALLVMLALLAVIFTGLHLYMRRWLQVPLHQLIEGIRRIAAGDYSHTLPAPPQEELRAIAREVNLMVQQIEAQRQDLLNSEKRYRSIFEGAIEGIFQESLDGALLTVNPAMADMFGYASPEEMLRLCRDTTRQLYHRFHDREMLMQVLRTSGEVSKLVLHMRHRHGKAVIVEVTARMVTADLGSMPHIEGMVSDITRQQKMEEELRQAQKMEAIGTLAGGIAHDFNNILSALFGYIELAQMRITDEKTKRHLDNALAGARRARDLVQQILTFSRKADHQKKPFPLAIIIKEACKLLRSSIPATIEIERDIHSQAIVVADPTQVHQVVMNLCTNSYHAMEKNGGTLTVRLYDLELTEEDNAIDEERFPPGRYAVLEVIDTGCGMDATVREKIFEPYFTTKPQGKGTGLGLALVHGIITSIHGRIMVRSSPGQGTTFRIVLPAVDSKEEAMQQARAMTIPQGRGQKIMLVDDEEPIREVLSSFLEAAGYSVRTFASGRLFLAALEEDPHGCDLVITDMAMPKMTGAEIARRTRELREDLPIILCTGYAEDLSREQAEAIGIQTVIRKPIQRKQFLRIIYSALN